MGTASSSPGHIDYICQGSRCHGFTEVIDIKHWLKVRRAQRAMEDMTDASKVRKALGLGVLEKVG